MSSQNIRYTRFVPASENDHSNFRIFTLSKKISNDQELIQSDPISLPTAGSLAVIKRGVYNSSLFIFHRELYSVLSDVSLTS